MENRYDKYKDSGIAWIGEIPEHWEVRRLKHLGKNYNGLTYSPNDICGSEDGILVLRSSNIKDNKLCFDDNVYVKKEIPQKLIVNKGDILICSRNGSAELIGKAAFIELQMVATFGAFMMIFKGTSNIYHKYLFYIVTSCISQYKWLFTTATINQLTSSMLGEIFAPFINNNLEQKSIATYLDQKCGEIDELITLQEEMITKLQRYKQSVITEAVTKGLDKNVPLKDSGIEWIGKIPEYWKISKIKNHYNVILGKMVEKNNDSNTSGENYLCAANIKWNGVDTEINKKMYFSDVEKEKYLLQYNDVLIMEGGMAGTTCLYKNEFSPCYVQNSVNVCRAKKDFNNKFLYYWMYVPYYNGYVDTICNKATIKHYTKEKVQSTPILVPSLSEQQSIADYLDQKCSEIDELIFIKQQKIEKLKDYKKSLIFECVTGKRKVS